MKHFTIDNRIKVGAGEPLLIIGGPCAIESPELCLKIGQALRDRCAELGFNYIFKGSFDKANRSSIGSPRGPGLEQGLNILADLRDQLAVPVTTSRLLTEAISPGVALATVGISGRGGAPEPAAGGSSSRPFALRHPLSENRSVKTIVARHAPIIRVRLPS